MNTIIELLYWLALCAAVYGALRGMADVLATWRARR
jgi:hypothetical protein